MSLEINDLQSSCPLCKSPATQPRPGYQNIPPGGWSLNLCTDCGTSFIYPMPDSKTFEAIYDEDYYGHPEEGKFVGPVEKLVTFFRYLRARSVQRLVPSGRILDVGCGRGLMLTFLKRWGYEVDGIELDTVAAMRAEKNLGQKVFHSLEDITSASPPRYNAICFWHSLEHMPEPGNTLKIACELLAPGGILIIAAPHMGSLQSRLAGTNWLHLDLPYHVVHFNMDQLCNYFRSKGYSFLRHNHFSQEYNIIDTLCYLYAVIGFYSLFPFHAIRNIEKSKTMTWVGVCHHVLGLSMMVPLMSVAFCVSNLFSVAHSGSTTTLILRKSEDLSDESHDIVETRA